MEPYYPNKEDWDANFWKHNYQVSVGAYGATFLVNADCEGDALDYVIDYCVENLPGLVMSREEEEEEEYLEDYIQGGNEGRYLNDINVIIEQYKTK